MPDYPKAENDRLSVSAWVFAASPPPDDWAVIAANWGFDNAKRHERFSGSFTSICVRPTVV